mmetsp:Transcript_7357/g.7213  ORF Transcript_7357/g.7213 Transcript_7357/m.7213 type:complete len:83 (-) Transcript_7357:784-1032(-)
MTSKPLLIKRMVRRRRWGCDATTVLILLTTAVLYCTASGAVPTTHFWEWQKNDDGDDYDDNRLQCLCSPMPSFTTILHYTEI